MRDEYLPYTFEDFLESDPFVAWQRQPERQELAQAWNMWLTAHPEKRDEVEKAIAALQRLQPLPLPASKIAVDDLWSKIDQQTQEEKKVQNARTRQLWPRLAAAAAIVLVLTFYFLMPKSTRVDVASGQNLAYELPDDSRVFIHGDSRFSFSEKAYDQQREVHLKGEAFFDVASGSTFRVLTDVGQVEVLGTQFTVFQRGNLFEVHCREGRVQVTAEADSLVLTAGQAIEWKDNALTPYSPVSKGKRSAWSFSYEAEPLANIFREMERQFAVDINAPGTLNATKHTGIINMEDLATALDNLSYSYSFTYTIAGTKVNITKE